MDNLELRLFKCCILGFIIVLTIVFTIFKFKKNNTNRKRNLKKERRDNILYIIFGTIIFSVLAYLIGSVGLDMAFKDYETKYLVFSKISHNGSRNDLIWGYDLVFEGDFRCTTYDPIKKYAFLESNGDGAVYKVTYAKRTHLLISIEEVDEDS